jgi:hypothetical protein
MMGSPCFRPDRWFTTKAWTAPVPTVGVFFRQYQAARRVFPSFDFELPIPCCVEADLEAVRRTIWRQNGGSVDKTVDWVKKRTLALRG